MRSHWQVPGIRTWYVWGHLSASTMGFSKSHKEIFFSSVCFSFLLGHTWSFLWTFEECIFIHNKTERDVISLCALKSRLESQGQTENLWLTTSLNWRLHGMNCMYSCDELNHKRVCLPILSWKRLGFPSDSVVKNLPAKQETQVWSLGWKDTLEKEMATHSSILVWEIPWTKEPGGPQFTGSQSQTRLSD